MSTTVASLLGIMKVRLSMYETGVIAPPLEVIVATRALVAELDVLTPKEIVDIVYSRNPFHAQYIRKKTGKLLAEFTIDAGSLPS